MEINNISVCNDGYIRCKSRYYSSCDTLSYNHIYNFEKGINELSGEIDSGIWGISYLLSMYKYSKKHDIILYNTSEIMVNNTRLSLDEFSKYSCYMDDLYPMFFSKQPVRDLVSKGLKKSGSDYSVLQIKEIFEISNDRYERPLKEVGNEIFKAMASIGFSYDKQVYCFPWLSKKRFEYYNENITNLLETLSNYSKIIILPVGK